MKTIFKRLLKASCSAAIMAALGQGSALGQVTINYNSTNLFGAGVTNNRALTFNQRSGPFFTTVQPVNGAASFTLPPGQVFTMSIDNFSKQYVVPVPASGGPYNVIDLITYGFALQSPYPGIAGGAGVALMTNYVAGFPIYTLSNTNVGNTNLNNSAQFSTNAGVISIASSAPMTNTAIYNGTHPFLIFPNQNTTEMSDPQGVGIFTLRQGFSGFTGDSFAFDHTVTGPLFNGLATNVNGVIAFTNGGIGKSLNTNLVLPSAQYDDGSTYPDVACPITLLGGVKYQVDPGNDLHFQGLTDQSESPVYVPGGGGTFTASTNGVYIMVGDDSFPDVPCLVQVRVVSDLFLPVNPRFGDITATSLTLNTPLPEGSGGTGTTSLNSAITSAIATFGFAVSNAASATQTFFGAHIFNDGIYSIGATTLNPPTSQTQNFGELRVAFHANTNLMSQTNHTDSWLTLRDFLAYSDFGIRFQLTGTNPVGSVITTNSQGVKIYDQDDFGFVIVQVQDGDVAGDANQAGSFVMLNNVVGWPVYMSLNFQLSGESGGSGNNQHGLTVWDTRGFTNSTKPAKFSIPVVKANVYTVTNVNWIDAFSVNFTNGDVKVSSNLFANILTVTNSATLQSNVTVGGVITSTNGFGSLATNTFTVTTTGTTNTGTICRKLIGVVGATVIYSNQISHVSAALGTITVPQQITLEPFECLLAASGFACATNVAGP